MREEANPGSRPEFKVEALRLTQVGGHPIWAGDQGLGIGPRRAYGVPVQADPGRKNGPAAGVVVDIAGMQQHGEPALPAVVPPAHRVHSDGDGWGGKRLRRQRA